MSATRPMTTVIDAGDLRKYRTEIPNMVDDMGLSVYAFRLYAHLKRVAGDSGQCYQGRRKLAEHCGMSEGMITKAKRELVDRGLIELDPGEAKTSKSDTITIIDIWRDNFATFAKQPPGHQVTTPGHDMTTPGHTVTDPWSPGDHKKEPIKNKPSKKEPIGRKAPDPNSTHPAVMAYRETFKCNLSKAQAAVVAEANVELDDWVRAIHAWLGRGYSPKNVTGMLDWARNPKLAERQSGSAARPTSKGAISMAESDRAKALLRERMTAQ